MNKKIRKGLMIICGLCWAGLAFSTPLTPVLHIPAPEFDFGEVVEGSMVSHDFVIKNNGTSSLEIKDIRPG
jgi:hypothetical protein